MKIVLENSNVVVIAKDINISIFKPRWLLTNDIFSEEELKGDILITPPAIQISTENFHFLALPDRIQITIPRQYITAQSDIDRILGQTVKILPHTPYTGVGLNFNYLAAPDNEEMFSVWNKNFFTSRWGTEVLPSDDQNAKFGSYVSFDVLGGRLKLDVKPVKASKQIKNFCQSWHEQQDLVRLNFNFHNPVPDPSTAANFISQSLKKWSEAQKLSEELTQKISD